MKLTFTTGNLSHTDKGHLLILEIPRQNIEGLIPLLHDDKLKTIEIKHHKKKRSLDANSALWLVLGKMSEPLLTTPEELYIQYLVRYGVYETIMIKKAAIPSFKLKSDFRAYVERGERNIKGNEMVWLSCYYGSSKYDSKEFARLLEGVLVDSKEMGIDLITKEEQSRMIEEWDK
jgi:hypothetical protein